jgi:hypothetical protein
MKDPRLDPETVERMLRGEPGGPPELAAVLTAAAAGLTTEEPDGEAAAVAAFRATRPPVGTQPSGAERPSGTTLPSGAERRSGTTPPSGGGRPDKRRISAWVSLKTVLVGLVVVLTGGVTAAVAAQHLPGPLKGGHSHSEHTPTMSQTGTPTVPRQPSPPHRPNRPDRSNGPDRPHRSNRSDQTDRPDLPATHPRRTPKAPHPEKHPHPTGKAKDKKIDPPKPHSATGPRTSDAAPGILPGERGR